MEEGFKNFSTRHLTLDTSRGMRFITNLEFPLLVYNFIPKILSISSEMFETDKVLLIFLFTFA